MALLSRLSIALLLLAHVGCGGHQPPPAKPVNHGPGADAPSYDEFQAWRRPCGVNRAGEPSPMLLDPDIKRNQVVAAMEPGPAAQILAVYLHHNTKDEINTYQTIMWGIPHPSAGKILDALPADVQLQGINVLDASGSDRALAILCNASPETYAKLAPNVNVIPPRAKVLAETAPATPATPPAPSETPPPK